MDSASFRPCYNQKFFWIDGNLIAFEFGEDRVGNLYNDEVIIYIRARYVWHHTSSQGIMVGNSGYTVGPTVSFEEGQRLFDLADEAGAAEWWIQWKKREQMTDPYGLTKIGQDIKRRVWSIYWHMRRWWRRKPKHSNR